MEHIERLEKVLSDLESNAGKLSSLPELVQGIKEIISLYKEANDSINQSGIELKEIEKVLNERLEDLQKTLKVEQESKDELMNSIRSILTSNNKEQLDAVNSITTVVGNKISVAESNLTVKATEIENGVKHVELKATENETKLLGITNGVASLGEKVASYGDANSADLKELILLIPIIKRTQIIAIVGAVLALAACIIGIAI